MSAAVPSPRHRPLPADLLRQGRAAPDRRSLCERLQTATAELRRRSAGVPGPSSQPLLCRLTALWPALLPLLSDEAEAVGLRPALLDALGQLWDAAEEGRAAVDGRPSRLRGVAAARTDPAAVAVGRREG